MIYWLRNTPSDMGGHMFSVYFEVDHNRGVYYTPTSHLGNPVYPKHDQDIANINLGNPVYPKHNYDIAKIHLSDPVYPKHDFDIAKFHLGNPIFLKMQ